MFEKHVSSLKELDTPGMSQWDIGPKIPIGPSPRPSWTAHSNEQFHEGQPLYIQVCHNLGSGRLVRAVLYLDNGKEEKSQTHTLK